MFASMLFSGGMRGSANRQRMRTGVRYILLVILIICCRFRFCIRKKHFLAIFIYANAGWPISFCVLWVCIGPMACLDSIDYVGGVIISRLSYNVYERPAAYRCVR